VKYSKYPNYKDSGVDWLGEIPEHWIHTRLKFLTSITTGDKDTENKEPEGEYPFFVRSKTIERINSYSYDGEAILTAGDGDIGKIFHYINGKFDYHQRVYMFYKFLGVKGLFLYYYLLENLSKEVIKLSAKTTVDSLRLPMLQNFVVSVPPLQEQQTIANYLDKATAKIDTLIEKQTKLIELLREKRQAVISTAVTRGLDNTVAMKDSGVEWLGEIPEGWISTKVKNMLSTPITDGPHETPEFLDEGVPFISAEAISKGFLNFSKIRGHISDEANRVYSLKYSPMLHDVYMIKSGATTGVTAMVEDRVNFNIWSPLAVFRSNTKLNPYYLLNYLRSSNFQKAVELYWSYGTQQNIGMNVLENLYIAVPPIEEQQAIADYLDDKTLKIDTLVTKATKAIELLKEKRTALISATVTGKIDVREAA